MQVNTLTRSPLMTSHGSKPLMWCGLPLPSSSLGFSHTDFALFLECPLLLYHTETLHIAVSCTLGYILSIHSPSQLIWLIPLSQFSHHFLREAFQSFNWIKSPYYRLSYVLCSSSSHSCHFTFIHVVFLKILFIYF